MTTVPLWQSLKPLRQLSCDFCKLSSGIVCQASWGTFKAFLWMFLPFVPFAVKVTHTSLMLLSRLGGASRWLIYWFIVCFSLFFKISIYAFFLFQITVALKNKTDWKWRKRDQKKDFQTSCGPVAQDNSTWYHVTDTLVHALPWYLG